MANEKPQTEITALEPYMDGKHHVLMPTQGVARVAPWHNVRVSLVRVNTDPEAGEIYKVGSKREKQNGRWTTVDYYSLAKPVLMRIANAAGIVWVPNAHRLAAREVDPQTKRLRYVRFETLGMLRLPDGSWQSIPGTYDVDLLEIEEEQRRNLHKRVRDGLTGNEGRQWFRHGLCEWRTLEGEEYSRMFIKDPDLEREYVEANLLPYMQQWRKTAVRRAESGAMLRAIRSALGMKMQFTAAELQKPFAVPRVEWAPDMSDPQVRQMVLAAGVHAMTGLFTQIPAMTGGVGMGPMPGETVRDPLPQDDGGDFDEAAARAELTQQPPVEPEVVDVAPEPGSSVADAMAEEAAAAEPPEPAGPVCSDCGQEIRSHQHVANGRTVEFQAADIAAQTAEAYGRALCWECAQKEHKKRAAAAGRTAPQPNRREGGRTR